MSQMSRRKLHLVFGAAVLASLGFGTTQVVAEARPSGEKSTLVCPATRPVHCYCEEGIEWCQVSRPCKLCP